MSEFMKVVHWLPLIYLILINLAGFLSMMIDKNRAKKGKWRVSEKTLFLIAIIGGSLGSIIGMRIWHHKTKHWYFVVGMPFILALQILLAGYAIYMLFFK